MLRLICNNFAFIKFIIYKKKKNKIMEIFNNYEKKNYKKSS